MVDFPAIGTHAIATSRPRRLFFILAARTTSFIRRSASQIMPSNFVAGPAMSSLRATMRDMRSHSRCATTFGPGSHSIAGRRTRSRGYVALALVTLLLTAGCGYQQVTSYSGRALPPSPESSPALRQVIASALEQTNQTVHYDPAYVRIDYPGGDVPIERGVCSDVIVRAFRKAGVDLQKEVHEDMSRSFASYPRKWGLSRPDTNIDHRRVLNLRTYFERKQKSLPITRSPGDYQPGDIVSWELSDGVDHVGLVSNIWSDSSQRYMVVHNIGSGVKVADVLFAWRVTGHYRYF